MGPADSFNIAWVAKKVQSSTWVMDFAEAAVNTLRYLSITVNFELVKIWSTYEMICNENPFEALTAESPSALCRLTFSQKMPSIKYY